MSDPVVEEQQHTKLGGWDYLVLGLCVGATAVLLAFAIVAVFVVENSPLPDPR